jgi:valyl-tRNA synthetase
VNQWIIGEVVDTLRTLDKAMVDLRFDAAAHAIYQFAWGTFCDWYLELIKGYFVSEKQGGVEPKARAARVERADEARAVAGWVLDQILVMLHPFMPFITEELWHAQGPRTRELIVSDWPNPQAQINLEAQSEINWVVDTIKEIRSARNLLNVPVGAKPMMEVYHQSESVKKYLYDNQSAFMRLARVGLVFPEGGRTEGSAWDQVQTVRAKKGAILIEREGLGANIPVEEFIDVAAEKARLAKAREAALKERDSLAKRLENPAFVEKAKPEAVEKARADHAHHAAEADRLEAALARLG